MQELRTKRENKEDIYQWDNLAAFLPPGRALHYPGSDLREKLPAPLQQEILAFLNEALAEDIPFHKLDENLALFARLQRMETKPILRQLLKRPSRIYAEKAAQVLRAMSEDVPPIPPDPPVRLRFFLNGKPWPVLEMTYAIPAEEPLTGTSGYLKTDADGFAEIPRDFFLNPANTGTRFIVSCAPQNGNVWNGQEYERPWVSAECPLPRRFDETVRVDFTACPLPLEIEYFVSPDGPPRVSTRIRLMKEGRTGLNDGSYQLDFEDEGFVAPERLTLTTLQPGLYRLLIAAPGSARWFSEPIDVQPGMAPLRVKLEQGSDLYASIFVPINSRGTGLYRLFRDGEDISERYPKETYDDNGPLFSGLPKGRYQLRILSTREYMEKNQIKEWPEKEPFYTRNLREAADCEAVAVDFTIDEKTPALLDLGRIEIPAVPAMREKAGALRQITRGLSAE